MTLDELRALATGSRGDDACWPAPLGTMAVTLPEADFLYALVRTTRPRRVLEFGTGKGISGRFIAEALADNANGGFLLSVEPDRAHWPDAEGLLRGTPSALTQTGDFSPDDELVEFVYIDSAPEYRAADIREWLTNGYQGLVAVHDAARLYPEFSLGVGVWVPSQAGFWIGRAA